jgi:uncharacterized protein YbaR (Trm112 family)
MKKLSKIWYVCPYCHKETHLLDLNLILKNDEILLACGYCKKPLKKSLQNSIKNSLSKNNK